MQNFMDSHHRHGVLSTKKTRWSAPYRRNTCVFASQRSNSTYTPSLPKSSSEPSVTIIVSHNGRQRFAASFVHPLPIPQRPSVIIVKASGFGSGSSEGRTHNRYQSVLFSSAGRGSLWTVFGDTSGPAVKRNWFHFGMRIQA